MRTLRYAILMAALLLIPSVYSISTSETTPFLLTVVDRNGLAVPDVQVSTDNGIVCHTNKQGNVTWPESSLMNRRARFSVDTPGYKVAGGGMILVMHGKRSQLVVSHTSS